MQYQTDAGNNALKNEESPLITGRNIESIPLTEALCMGLIARCEALIALCVDLQPKVRLWRNTAETPDRSACASTLQLFNSSILQFFNSSILK